METLAPFPDLQDFSFLAQSMDTADLYGSDCALANLFLLRQKYDIRMFVRHDVVFRRYTGAQNRTGWAFPVPLRGAGHKYLADALSYILLQSREEGSAAQFCLCTQEQKAAIDQCLALHFGGTRVRWDTDRADTDYIYLRENLAGLLGSQYQKKRNHISRFARIYGTDWEFRPFPEQDVAKDILLVEDTWFSEKDGEQPPALVLERQSVHEAVHNASSLGIRGGVLYVRGQPAAMTLASPVSANVLDVHYEKAVAQFEPDGAYAVVNNQFAKRCGDYMYLNREEDMGVEGLRKAKLSYKPTILLDKFFGRVS